MSEISQSSVKYSICMCNYNMAKTLDVALRSILGQIDARFEVMLVDDGSSDDSVKVIRKLQAEYPLLRLVRLQKDSNRQLGFTRNISIQEAKGEYVLLHLDCDDVIAPFILDFVKIFHQIESVGPKEFLLSGRPIQMARRDFLLQRGPYRNIHRGEDRDLWARLAAEGAYIPLEHQTLKTMLPKSFGEKLYRAVFYTFDHTKSFFRKSQSNTLKKCFIYELNRPERISLHVKMLRLSIILPAWIMAKIQGPLPEAVALTGLQELTDYYKNNCGSFPELMKRYGGPPDWQALSPEARSVF